jgi:photosystem II stability/assembly factor-like uncharacterized protein
MDTGSLRLQAARSWALALLALTLLAGCESPLDLGGVEAERASAIRRSDLYQAAAGNGRALVVVGRHGVALRSSDAGASWQRQEIDGWPGLIDVTACPDGRFAALAAESQVFVSADNAASWAAQSIPTQEPPQGIACDPAGRLWVVGSFSTIVVSSDGGRSWEDRSTGEDTIITTIQFIDERTAVVFGEFGVNLRSADGGDTWTAGEPLPGEFYAQDALFTDRDTGWVAGLAGQVLHTADGGESWRLEQTPTLVPIYGLTATKAGVFAVGGEGTLLRRDAEGWRRVAHDQPVRLFLRIVQGIGEDRLLIGGAAGALHVVPAASRG